MNTRQSDTPRNKQRIGERLRDLRVLHGLTLDALSRATGIDESTLSRIETGARDIRVEHIPLLARAFGVSPEALTHDTLEFNPLHSLTENFRNDLEDRHASDRNHS